MRQVAVLDWTRLVTPSPASSAVHAVADAHGQDVAQVLAEDAQDAGAHELRAPDQQGHRSQQIEQMNHESRIAHRSVPSAFLLGRGRTRSCIVRAELCGTSGTAIRTRKLHIVNNRQNTVDSAKAPALG